MDLLFEANRLAGELAADFKKSLLLEADKSGRRTIVAYSGHFQPFHEGHYKVYKTLVKKFDRDNVYITTTNESDEFENPLTFDDKKKIITKMFNIEEGKFQEVENPFVPKELLKKFNPKQTSFITVVTPEDAAALSKSKYFEHYSDSEPLKPYAEAGYYLTVPEIRAEVGNQALTGQQIMQVLGSSKTKPKMKEKLFKALYGKNDDDVMNMIVGKAKSGADEIDGQFVKTKATGNTATSKPGKTDATGQDNEDDDEGKDDKTPPMQRMIVNPDTGREIKVQSALKYPRWKPVYKKAEKILKSAGIDRKDRVKEPEVNQRYKARAKKMKKEDLAAYLGATLFEQLHEQFLREGVKLTVPGLGEVLLRLDEQQIISESGAAGHLLHPYEDPDLSFDDLEKIVTRGLSGGLDAEAPVTEKLDGQNIMFSVRDGQIVFARSNTHVRNKGQNALDINALKDKFAGRGDIGDSFGNAAEDLQAAVAALPDSVREKMFRGGAKWVNLEIINPKTQNVIPYDKNILVFHNTVEYDDAGKAVQLGQDEGAALAKAIQKVGADKQKTFGIQGPQNIAFSDKTDSEYKARQDNYLRELDAIKRSVGLDANAKLGDYFTKKWRERIDTELKKNNLQLDDNTRNHLAARWAVGDKTVGAREFKKIHPELSAWFDGLDKNALNINKDIRKPVEMLFLRVGADSLVRMTNFMSANNPVVADAMKREVLDTIKKLKADPSNATENLAREFERLENIGFDKITPTEGVVFIYNGKPYKFTGSFAPVNQLLGALKYSKKEPQDTTTGETPEKKVELPGGKKPVVVYPGRFQPFHAGHYSVYKHLVDKYGKDNVFIGTSNKTDNVKSPFNFNEKQTVMTKMFGIPSDKIIQVTNPYAPKEITAMFPEDTPFITAFSEKDAERLGGTGYYRPLPDKPENLGGYREAGYFSIVPEFQLDVDGQNISGTTVRSVMGDPKRSLADKKKLFTAMYGKFDQGIFDLVTGKLASMSATPATKSVAKPVAKKIVAKKAAPAAKVIRGKGSVLNKKVRNPETNRDILVKTALGYDKKHPAYKAAAKMIRTEAIIFEGGNAVTVNSKIPNQFAQSSASNIANKLGLGKLDSALVGSTHKPVMNDLDVAMDFEEVKQAIGYVGTDKKEFFAHLKSYLDKTGLEVNVQPGFQQFSIAAPLVDATGQPQDAIDDDGKSTGKPGNIQVDFMMGDLPFMKRFLTNGDKSAVSSTYRNVFIMDTLRNLAEDTDTPGVKKRYLINTRDGIYEETFTEKPNGKRETITKERVSNDVDFLAQIMFGPDAKFDEIDTFEKLAKRITQPDVKFRDKLPAIVNQFKDTITKMKKELPAGIPDTNDPSDIKQAKTPEPKTPEQPKSTRPAFDAKILNTKVKNPETGNDILVKTALKYDKTHPAYKAAAKVVRNNKK